jgi:hypothetical protein
MGKYDTAQVCINGHMVNASSRTQPQHNAPRCARCSGETITVCRICKTRILGRYHVPGVANFTEVPVPAFCRNCARPFPWTASSLKAARILAEESDSLSATEREELKASLDDLVRDTPETLLAATRFKKLMLKAGKGTAEGLKQVLTEIARETAKKAIWGP